MSPNVWAVALNFNGKEDTRKCLHSLRAVRYAGLSVIVVDNASTTDPTAELRAEFPWCHFIRNPVNGGWAGGNNVGIRYALERGADHVLLLNNDTTVSPHLVDWLLDASAAYPQFGVIGPVIHFMDNPAEVMTDGCVFNRPGYNGFFQRKPVPLDPSQPPTLTEVDVVNGCAMMVKAEVFRRIGFIDERFFLIHEETDFCLRGRQAGFGCGVLNRGLVWHKGSSTFQRSGKAWQRYYDARNLALLLRKHAASHRGGRRPLRSWLQYGKYVYYRYAIEREEGRTEGAEAVLEGLCDALTGHYGAHARHPRTALPMVRGLVESWFARRTRKIMGKETVGAAAVR